MSDPNDHTNENPNASEQSAPAGTPTTNVALSGVTGQAVAGDLNPARDGAEVAAHMAATAMSSLNAAADDPTQVDAAGTVIDPAVAAAAGLPTQTPPPVDESQAFDVTLSRQAFLGMSNNLDKMERIALFWGGERGVELRNLVCATRELLTGVSHTE